MMKKKIVKKLLQSVIGSCAKDSSLIIYLTTNLPLVAPQKSQLQ
jgi:hypothetical protein